MPRRDLVGRTRPWAPAALWALFLLQTAVIARWPGFFLDTLVDNLIRWLRAGAEPRLPGLRQGAAIVARLGAREVLIPVAIVSGAVLAWRRRNLLPPALLAGAYLLVAAGASLVKAGLARPQPLPVPGVPGRAFPSGHVAQAVVVLGALALLLLADGVPDRRRRRRILAGAAGVVLAVSAAMLWRQAHWLTDIVGGVTLGLACLATADVVLGHVLSRPASRERHGADAP